MESNTQENQGGPIRCSRKRKKRKKAISHSAHNIQTLKKKNEEERSSYFQSNAKARKPIYIIGGLLGTAMTVFVACFSNPKNNSAISASSTEEKDNFDEKETVDIFWAASIPESFSFLGSNYQMLFTKMDHTKGMLLGYIVNDESKIEGLKKKNPDIDCAFLVDTDFYDYYQDSIAPIYSLVGYDHYEYICLESSFDDNLFYIV